MLDPFIRSGDGSDGGGDQCDPRFDVLATQRDPELERPHYLEGLSFFGTASDTPMLRNPSQNPFVLFVCVNACVQLLFSLVKQR